MPARSVCMVTTLTGVAWMCPESVCILTKAKFSSVGQSIQTFPGGAIVCTCTSSTVLVTDPSPHGFVLPVNVWVAVHMQACESFPQPKGEPGDGDLHLYVGETCNMPLARESPIMHCHVQHSVASNISAWKAMSDCIMTSHGASKEAARQSNLHLMLSPARPGRNFYNG